MNEQQSNEPTPDEVAFGTPAPSSAAPSRARRTGRAMAWVAVGAIGATALTGVAFAANRTESGSPTPSAAPSGAPSGAPGEGAPGQGGARGHGGPGHGGLFGGLRGDVLHGEFVVKDGTSTKTMLSQSGDVTAVSSTSLTVKSSDGFTATWTLSSSTKVHAFAKGPNDAKVSDIKVGASVEVVGTKDTATTGAATTVGIRPTAAELKKLQESAPQGGHGFGHGRPGDGSAPSSTPSASASTT